MVQFESFKGSVVRVTAVLSLAETWVIDSIDVVTLLGGGGVPLLGPLGVVVIILKIGV
jgi:hypothetical protein